MNSSKPVIIGEYTTPEGELYTYFCLDGTLYEESDQGLIDIVGTCDECPNQCELAQDN